MVRKAGCQDANSNSPPSFTTAASRRSRSKPSAVATFVTINAISIKATRASTVTRTQSQTFNALSQLTAVVDGLNRTVFSAANVGYDAHANRVQSTDALGVASQQGFDALNRLVSTVGDANGTSTATKNAQSVFSYDALDRIDGASDPDGISTLYTWDALSNRTAPQSPTPATAPTPTMPPASDPKGDWGHVL